MYCQTFCSTVGLYVRRIFTKSHVTKFTKSQCNERIRTGPKLAGQNRVSLKEITGEVTFGKVSLDEIDGIVVHEKLVKRVRIFHVGAIDGGDVRRWITGTDIVFQKCSKNSEPLCTGVWCANFARNIPNKEAAPVFVITAVQHFDIVRTKLAS